MESDSRFFDTVLLGCTGLWWRVCRFQGPSVTTKTRHPSRDRRRPCLASSQRPPLAPRNGLLRRPAAETSSEPPSAAYGDEFSLDLLGPETGKLTISSRSVHPPLRGEKAGLRPALVVKATLGLRPRYGKAPPCPSGMKDRPSA